MTQPTVRMINALDHWNRHGGQPLLCRMGHGALHAAQGPDGAYQWRCRLCPALQPVDAETCRVAMGFADLGPAAIVGNADLGASATTPVSVISASGLSQALIRRVQHGRRPVGVAVAIVGLYGAAGLVAGLIIGAAASGDGFLAGALLGVLVGAVLGAVYALAVHPARRTAVTRRTLTPARFLPAGALVAASADFRGSTLARVAQVRGLPEGHPTHSRGVGISLSNGAIYPANPDLPVEVWSIDR